MAAVGDGWCVCTGCGAWSLFVVFVGVVVCGCCVS